MEPAANPLALSANKKHDKADPQETYHRAREGLICYMHNLGCHNFAWETLPKIDARNGRVIALFEALPAMHRHFGNNPAHIHTKKSRHQFARVGVSE